MRRVLLAAGLVTALGAPPSAGAALDFKSCATPKGVQCAEMQVPIDRTGAVPGSFPVLVQRVPARHPAGRPPLVFLAGGPGQTNTDITPFAIERYRAALDDRDLIVFSQRGTGPSEIHCPALERGDDPSTAVPACAQQLGAAANFFTSRDAADDLDDVRQALGVEKVTLAAASYGTWVEQAYAIRHPQHVERMVLDSTVGPDQNADPFGLEQFAEAPALARALCHRHACRGITKDPYKDLLKLFARLGKTPVMTHVVRPDGGRDEVTLSPLAVASLLPQLDVRGHLRAELPRAGAAALRGDPAPLARLVFGAPSGPPPEPRSAQNQTLFFATHCEEDVQPFDRTAAPADRLAQARERVAAIPPASFAPFGPDIAFLLSNVPTCAYWPMRAEQPSFGPGPPADVPVLLIHGEFDLRSSRASTDTVAGEFPHSKVLIVPNTGHSATRSELTRCARTAAARFLVKRKFPGPCRIAPDPFAPRPLVPRALHAAGGRRAAARMTVADAFDQLDAGSQGRTSAEPKVRGGGLRGGTFHGSKKGLVLVRYEFVKGFPVSGLVPPRGVALLKVPGGTLRFGAHSGLVRRTIAARYPLTR
jgi:pimeloyl-ACP methyl ester carboxylesterase